MNALQCMLQRTMWACCAVQHMLQSYPAASATVAEAANEHSLPLSSTHPAAAAACIVHILLLLLYAAEQPAVAAAAHQLKRQLASHLLLLMPQRAPAAQLQEQAEGSNSTQEQCCMSVHQTRITLHR
jgi:hypothetical protein